MTARIITTPITIDQFVFSVDSFLVSFTETSSSLAAIGSSTLTLSTGFGADSIKDVCETVGISGPIVDGKSFGAEFF